MAEAEKYNYKSPAGQNDILVWFEYMNIRD